MSEKINDGGPAFPRSSYGPAGNFDQAEGMSLRDWFAGMALSGELASSSTTENCMIIAKGAVEAKQTVEEFLATTCYQMADAMIAERQKAR